MQNVRNKLLAIVVSIVLAMSMGLVACNGNAGGKAGSSATVQSGQLVGSPWVTSVLIGNLQREQPSVKDDLYTHYNYEYLATHQDQPSSLMDEYADELKASVTSIIKDTSKTDHDLDQLRTFYNQAADTASLQATGLSELQPYLDRIDSVKSLDEMNALLTADDFPFSPFITANVTINDTRTTNIVSVNANLMLFDTLLVGGTYYQDSDDPQVQKNMQAVLSNAMSTVLVDLVSSGMSVEDASALSEQLLSFEKAHGKYVESSGTYVKEDYGVMAAVARDSYLSPDEMYALSSNYPLKGTLEKLGKDGSKTYVVTKKWLEAFNKLWTEENLETIKLVAKVKVLGETRLYRDPTARNAILEQSGQPPIDADSFAYKACTSLDTFGNVVAKTYVDNVLGSNAKSRLTALSQKLVNEYKENINKTTWVGDESKQRIIDKLDNMTLNVLEPEDGYFDYSSLTLTPSDQGGTLFSNYLKLKQYRQDCESALIGQPASASVVWYAATPVTANAFYDPTSNSINILPGYVTSLIYTDNMTDTELLARAGFTIGHEISHSFDYSGSQVDAFGTPNPVFTDADVDKFVLKCTTLAMYYKGIEIQPGQNVDGESIVGEAAADLCGMQACLELGAKDSNFDYDAFFANCAGVLAEVKSKEALQQQTLGTHTLNNLRINVSTQMFSPIYDKLGVAQGDKMYLAPNERIAIWGENS